MKIIFILNEYLRQSCRTLFFFVFQLILNFAIRLEYFKYMKKLFIYYQMAKHIRKIKRYVKEEIMIGSTKTFVLKQV